MNPKTIWNPLGKRARFGSLLLGLLLCVGLFTSCGWRGGQSEAEGGNFVHLTVKDYGEIVIELYPEIAPKTVANFKKLVSEGFYDGLTFHRIVEDFVIQGGDPKGDSTGGSDETIPGEFAAAGFENSLSHTRGVVSMARAQAYDSASSQFFIVLSDTHTSSLDGLYAAFGKVVEGMDVVDAIVAAYSAGTMTEKPVMEKVVLAEN